MVCPVGQGQADLTPAYSRRVKVLHEHFSHNSDTYAPIDASTCRATTSRPEAKVAKAAEAVALIPDAAVITVRLASKTLSKLTICFRA